MKKLIFLAIIIAGFSCGKKKSTSQTATTPTTTTKAPLKDVNAVYAAMNTQVKGVNIVGAVALPLADAAWVDADWETTTSTTYSVGGSASTPKLYVADQLSPTGTGPVQEVTKKLAVFCYIGSLFTASDIVNGLPKVAAAHLVTVTDAMVSALENNCGLGTADAQSFKQMSLKITVTAATGTIFDRNIIFDDGSTPQPFSLKNSGGIVALGLYEPNTEEGNGKTGIERTIFKFNQGTGVFQFEKVAFGQVGLNGNGFEELIRGYRNTTAKEVAFLNINTDASGDISFVGFSGNEGQTQAGAYLGTITSSSSSTAFVCFNKTTQAFINSTACTQSSSDNRKRAWSTTQSLYTTISGKSASAWKLSDSTDVPAFDQKTMFTLAPNYAK